MAKKEIEIKTWLTRQEMVKYLEELAACLAQGKVVLQRGGDFLEFSPAQSMELELEGVHKKGLQKISIEISWRQVVLESADEPLKISSQAPAPLPEPQEPKAVTAGADHLAAASEQLAAEPPAATPGATSKGPQNPKEEPGKAKGPKQSGK